MPRSSAVTLVLCLAVLPGSLSAQHPPSSIWEREIPPQPFESRPFRPVKIPAWVEETIGCGYTLSGMSSAARARAAQHGVTLSEIGFVDPFYPYYDSKLLKRRSPHVPLGRLEKDIAEYKKLGVRLLGVYPPTLQSEVYELHPDWRRVATDTTVVPQVDLKKHPYGGMLCPLGPYGDFFIEVLAEIVTLYPDVAAFSFDGLHHGGFCYCEHCRKNYRKDTGKVIPKATLNDPEFRRYQHWADRRLEDLVRRMQERLKGINRDIALVTWTTNAGRYGHFLSLPRNMSARMNLLFDAPDQEFWLDETNRGLTIVPSFASAYAWAVTNHRVAFSEPYLMAHGNPYGKDSFPPHEILRRMLLTITHGAMPSLAVAQPARMQEEVYRVLDEVQRRKPWLTHKQPERWAALLMSDNTRAFYGREAGRVEERYLANVFGTFRACMEEHLPVTVINDWNLNPTDLAKYQLLLLPNAAALDERQVTAIRQFVRDGGGLIASLDTSLFDEFGTPRNDFALADVLGVNYRGLPEAKQVKEEIDINFAQAIGPDYWEKRKSVFDLKLNRESPFHRDRLATWVGTDPVTFKGPAVRVTPRADATVQARIQAKGGTSELPGLVTQTFGKGRVVYLAAGLDAGYYLYSYPYQRLILKEALGWATPSTPPIRVAAPMCVQSTIMRQSKDQKERLIVHLFNNVNTTAGHALPNDDIPLREETIPIADIRVTFRPDYRIQSVRLEPEGQPLTLEKTPEGQRVTVPRLEVHSMIVAELAGQ